MEYDLIETPENVELEQKLAGIGTRFLAGFVDTMLIFLAGMVLVLSALLIFGTGTIDHVAVFFDDSWVVAFLIVIFFLLFWGYFAIFEFYMNGQTPGKRYIKIRVVKEGGGAIDFNDVIIRNLLRTVDGFPFYPVAGIVMFVTRKIQRLGDLAAGTVVVSEAPRDYSASSDRPQKIEWTPTISAETLRKTNLTPEEYRILANYQKRRDQMTIESRERLLKRILPPILNRLGQSLEDDSPGAMEYQVDRLLWGDETEASSPDEDEQR